MLRVVRHLLLLKLLTLSLIGGESRLPEGHTLDGTVISPLAAATGIRAAVLYFTAPDCPISNRYAPAMARLADEFAPQGIKSWLVYSDDLADAAAIKTHQQEFNLTLPAIIDREFVIADYADADVTPEAAVFVFSEEGDSPRLVYRGRIDDQYQGFGKYRPEATHHDLRSILVQVGNGTTPEFTATKAIGCYIPRPPPSK